MGNLLGSTIFYFFVELVSSFFLQIVLSPFCVCVCVGVEGVEDNYSKEVLCSS